MCLYVCVWMCVCVCIYTYVCKHIYIRKSIHIALSLYLPAQAHNDFLEQHLASTRRCKNRYGVATINRLLEIIGFAEYRLFHRALLQKRPIILRILLIVATQLHSLCYSLRLLQNICLGYVWLRLHAKFVTSYILNTQAVHYSIYSYAGLKSSCCVVNRECIHIYIHSFIHACIHTYTHSCMHTYTHTSTHSYIHTYIHTFI